MSKLDKLKKQYEDSCNQYAKLFCEKQDMEFGGWVGNQIGGIAYCNDFFFNLHDITWDLNSNQPVGLIVDWYYECVDNPKKAINYYSYTKLK